MVVEEYGRAKELLPLLFASRLTGDKTGEGLEALLFHVVQATKIDDQFSFCFVRVKIYVSSLVSLVLR